jgi:hypothetical protein
MELLLSSFIPANFDFMDWRIQTGPQKFFWYSATQIVWLNNVEKTAKLVYTNNGRLSSFSLKIK